MSRRFFCHARDRWLDSWTYGDWRQWICNRPGGGKGPTQCARVSSLPGVLALIAVIGLIPLPMAVWLRYMGATGVILWRAEILFAVAAVYLVAWAVFERSGWALMVAVGPMNDGSRRVLPGEEA